MALADSTFITALDALSTSAHVSPGMTDHTYNTQLVAAIKAYLLSGTVTGPATGAQGGGAGVPIVGTIS